MKRHTVLSILERYLDASAVLSGDEAQFHCPFCLNRLGSEGTDLNLWINTRTGKGFCYRCEIGFGSVRSVLRALGIQATPEEVASLLLSAPTAPADQGALGGAVSAALTVSTPAPVPAAGPSRLRPVSLPAEFIPLAETEEADPRVRTAWAYLHGRGHGREAVERWGIGYCPSGRAGLHLVFPVRQWGSAVYYTTRATHRFPPKSRNPHNEEGFHTRTSVLLGFDRVRGQGQVEIAEGPFSAMALPNGVALLGKRASPEQIDLLRHLARLGTREFVVCLDADARQEALDLHAHLAPLLPRVTCVLFEEGDPDENRHQIHSLLRERREPCLVDAVKAALR